jgi:hypothetical protein
MPENPQEPRSGRYAAVGREPCRWCGKKRGSNRGRCILCWDYYVDITIGHYLDQHAREGNFTAAAEWFLSAYGSMMRPNY